MTEYTSYDLVDWGAPMERRRQKMPEPTGPEVLLRVTAAGVCHSDLHIRKGYMDLGELGKLTFAERGAKLPMTFGHEVAGIVEALGPKAEGVEIGQQVLVFPWIGCGDCEACQEDRESDCLSPNYVGLRQKGGFASHCIISDAKFLIDITGLDAADMVPHACSGLTVFNALEKVGSMRPGEWLAILGVGGLGLNAVTIASAMGFQNIVGVDIDDAKLDAAHDMGATAVLNSRQDGAVEELKRLTDSKLMGQSIRSAARQPPNWRSIAFPKAHATSSWDSMAETSRCLRSGCRSER
ncbi:MAG: alcohol dehydrogenase catalytic domain-containing protein [Pseudomonadota bacterium]